VIANNTSASSLTQSGTGTTQLTAANTYTGMTTVSAGTLNLQSSGNAIASTGNTADVVVSGTGTLALLGGDQIVNTANVAVSGGTLSMGNSSDTVHGVQLTGGSIIGTGGVLTSTTAFDMQNGSVSAGLGGSAGLTKSSGGTVSLSGANTYTGTTNVTAGILTTSGTMATTAVSVSSGASFTGTNTGANSAMATNAAVTNNGAMSLAASQTISTLNGTTAGATLAVARGSTLNVTGGGTYAGAINDISGTGAGANLTAGGSLTLQGNNAYTGATVVSAGATLAVTGSGAVGGTSSVTVNSGATFELNAAATNAVNSGANYVSNGGTLSIGPNLQTFALMKLGTGVSSTLNFNNVAGTLSFGSLDSSTKTALSSSPITLNIDNWTGSAYTIGTSSVTLDPLQSSLIFSNDPGFTLGQVIPGVYFAGYGAGMAVTVQVAGGGTAYQIVPATVVPEPATAALLGSVALCALIGCRKRRRSPGF
jgi:autotransporter-associated beta strand protein